MMSLVRVETRFDVREYQNHDSPIDQSPVCVRRP
jgi:hypothetical protein